MSKINHLVLDNKLYYILKVALWELKGITSFLAVILDQILVLCGDHCCCLCGLEEQTTKV